jgi:hypothetical protein
LYFWLPVKRAVYRKSTQDLGHVMSSPILLHLLLQISSVVCGRNRSTD